MMNKQIRCKVKDCIHNNQIEACCMLDSICVDNTYSDEEAYEKEDTVCDDFECKSNCD